MAINKALFSNEKNDWETPPELFKRLDSLFGYTLDAAANKKNALCSDYFTEQDKALEKQWISKAIFCNPPYDEKIQDKFIEKTIEQYKLQHFHFATLLIPSRTETKRFQKILNSANFVLFISGRLRFYVNGVQAVNTAPFPSALVFYVNAWGRGYVDKIRTLKDLGRIVVL